MAPTEETSHIGGTAKGSTPSGGAPADGPSGVAKHGLDDATSPKAIALIKEQEEPLPTRFAIAALCGVDSSPSPAPAPSVAAPTAWFPIGAPVPSVSATVAASIPGQNSSLGSVVDTDQFLCQPANYDATVVLLYTRDISDCLHLKDSGR
jgi:hypothetical protein